MDSNFQVRITANITDLQNSIKTAQSTLKELKATTDNASSSFSDMSRNASKVGAEMNRARLATFAFGQVIRDAGFFSQSFGLGILAISNNVPILIDQLVLLSGVSAGLGSVLSVLGSVLAAGLTIFAYWAQSVERDGGTVSGAINKMANDSQSSIGRLVDYLNQPPASEILGKAVNGVQQGMDAIKKIIDAGVKLAIALWERFGPAVLTALDKFFAMAKNVMLISLNILRLAAAVVQGDWTGALNAIGNIGKLVFNNLIELAQAYIGLITKGLGAVVSLYDPLKGAMIQAAGQQVVKLGDSFKFATEGLGGFNFDLLKLINNLFSASDATGKAKGSTETYASVIAKLRDELEQLDYTFTGTFGDKQEGRIKALQNAIEGLRKLGFEKTSQEVKALSDEIGLLVNQQNALKAPLKTSGVTQSGNMPRTTGNVTGFNIKPGELDMGIISQAEAMLPSLNEVYLSIAATITDGMAEVTSAIGDGIGKMIAGEMGLADFGKSILASIGGFLSQLGKQMIAFGFAALFFSKVAAALAAGDFESVALAAPGLIAAGFALTIAGALIKSLAGGKGNAAGVAGGGMASGGFSSSFTKPMSNAVSSSMYGRYNGTLETRVSGNDLVILMNRADRNRRGNY